MELEILPVLIIFEFILLNILKSTVPFIMFSLLLPLFERALLVLNDNYIILPNQINGKRRAEIKISKSLSNKEVENLALKHKNIIKFLTETPKKIIYIPNKIINIVI